MLLLSLVAAHFARSKAEARSWSIRALPHVPVHLSGATPLLLQHRLHLIADVLVRLCKGAQVGPALCATRLVANVRPPCTAASGMRRLASGVARPMSRRLGSARTVGQEPRRCSDRVPSLLQNKLCAELVKVVPLGVHGPGENSTSNRRVSNLDSADAHVSHHQQELDASTRHMTVQRAAVLLSNLDETPHERVKDAFLHLAHIRRG
eukprot:2687412-Pyramimonas_sp.AAC.1